MRHFRLVVLPLLVINLLNNFVNPAISQQLKFGRYSINDGLAHSTVNDVETDVFGNIWFATGNGLCKYNGRNFTTYLPDPKNPENSLPFYLIGKLYKDHKGNIWAFTTKGIAYYNVYEERFYNLSKVIVQDGKSAKLNNNRTNIYIDKDSTLYVETDGLLAFNLKTKTSKLIEKYLFLNNLLDDIQQFYLSSDGHSYFTTKIGIFKLNGSEIPTKVSGDEFKETTPFKVCEHKGKLYVFSSDYYIYVYDQQLNKIIKKIDYSAQAKIGLNPNRRANEVLYLNGNFYVLFTTDLMVVNEDFNNYRFFYHDINDPYSLSSSQLNSMCIDNSNNLWISTTKGGVSHTDLSNTNFQSYYNIPFKPNSLPHNDILGFCHDYDNNLWIGTFNNGIIRLNQQTGNFTVFSNTNPSVQSGMTFSIGNAKIITDYEDNLYILTWVNALYRISKSKNPNFRAEKIIFENLYDIDELNLKSIRWNSRDIIFDKNRYLWIVSFGSGVAKVHLSTKKTFFYDQLKGINFWCIYEDSKGIKWLGSDNTGIYMLNDQSNVIKNFNQIEGDSTSLPSNHIKCIYEDKVNRHLWLGTGGGGLAEFDPETKKVIKVYNMQSGMSSNTIYGISEDANGNLWLTTDYGLCVFNKLTQKFNNYFTSDGLVNDEYGFNSNYLSPKNGKLYIGGSNGFDEIDPNNLRYNNTLPLPSIVELKINNNVVKPWDLVRGKPFLNTNINTAKTLTFTRKENTFSFSFSALHFSSPAKNKIAYKLEGFNDDWVILPQNKADVTFNNLPGGTYTLLVKACSGSGIWNENPLILSIKIIPNFYETWWFYTLLCMAVAAAVYKYFRDSKIKNEKTKRYLETEIEKQTAEIRKQNAELVLSRAKELEQNWINEGVNQLTEILSKSQENVDGTAQLFLNRLIKYTNAGSGLIALLNDDNENDPYLYPSAIYGVSEDLVDLKRIDIGDTLLGACFKTKEMNIIDNAPPHFFKISSGLGESTPGTLLLIPIKSEKSIIGVLELAFFYELESKTFHLLEKIIEALALNIQERMLTKKMKHILEVTNQQFEQTKQKDEEMRQIIEEMEATQEEFTRKEKAYLKKIKDYEEKGKLN